MKFAREAREPGYAARGPGGRPVGVEPLPVEGDSASTDSAESRGEPLHPGTDAPSLGGARRDGAGPRRLGGLQPGVGEVLSRALADPEPLVRGHAAWALGRVVGAATDELLASAAASEPDPWVAEEVEGARLRVREKSFGEMGGGAR